MDTSFNYMHRLQMYKQKSQYKSVTDEVKKRLDTKLKDIKKSRLSTYDNTRNLQMVSPVVTPKATQKHDMRLELEKWKAKKEQKKKEEVANKKKPFLAGGSGTSKSFGAPLPLPCKPSTTGRVTRSQSRAASSLHKPKAQTTIERKQARSLLIATETKATTNAGQQSETSMVSNSESSFEERLRSPKTREQWKMDEAARKAKKDQENPQSLILPPNDDEKVFEVDQFRQQLYFEMSRMSEKCDTWENIFSQTVLPENVQAEVLSAVGQARLLMSKKLRQFSILVERCARPEPGTALVTPADLQGFWDMVFMQVENVDLRFKKLEDLRARNWVEDEPVEMKKIMTPGLKKVVVKDAGGPSRIREFIAAARKAKKDQENPQSLILPPNDDEKVFEVDQFRQQLYFEMSRMSEKCDTWENIFSQTVLPENVQAEVLSAVGQARLLMSKKLRQFSILVERCARPEPGTALVTPADLQGFWDMVFMQVENVDLRFKKLEDLRARNWVEDEPVEMKKIMTPGLKKVVVKDAGGPSRIREFIAAARKAKKDQENPQSLILPPNDDEKVFEVDQFRQQLYFEMSRMSEKCDTWENIFSQTVLPENVQAEVLSAVGQARLLMSKKLRQFSILVERCARPEPGTALVTPADLQGFWDMVFMQVENVDLRFKKLEDLRARNWVEDEPVEMKKIMTPGLKKVVVKAAGGPSRIREFIAAARKAKKDQENPQSLILPPSDDEKVFEAGFFLVKSPQHSAHNSD